MVLVNPLFLQVDMPKRILFLSFYFEPDLCAGSFRNSPLAYELARQAQSIDVEIDVISTLPNRYSTYSAQAPEFEQRDNLTINRICIPSHQSGIKDQINSYRTYFSAANKLVKSKHYDMVYASSSRLFTAYLGYRIASKRKIPLYLDIRDIFVDTIKDVFPNPLVKKIVLPFMSFIENKTFSYASHINLISGGFRKYFQKFNVPAITEFTNGIDPVFLDATKAILSKENRVRTILYAGNIGEGQGLHRIIPEAAKALGESFQFRIIGDGGAKFKLMNAIDGLSNVKLLPPVSREMLIEEYNAADFLFMHLNDYDAFKKVLPSKVFELGVFQKPLIAGVSGYSRSFVENNLPGSILIEPCNSIEFVQKVRQYNFGATLDRSIFIEKFRRDIINQKMADSILSYI
jgi:glycosyltransferase involved in cell wall biosynthesis